MTDGVSSRSGAQEHHKKQRTSASARSSEILGFKWVDGGEFPDNKMDDVPLLEIVNLIEEIKAFIRPTIIYTHSAADLNIDHRITSQATLTAFRPQPNEVWQEIRTFEIPSATDYGHKSITSSFEPNLYIDIKSAWGEKLSALNAYHIEMRSAPHSRSLAGLENLAKLRGNQVGLEYAEAFEIIRKIERCQTT